MSKSFAEKLGDSIEKILEKSRTVVDQQYELPLVVASLLLVAIGAKLRSGKKDMKRDFNDFDGVVTGSTSMLSNADSVLKRDEVKGAIDEYEDLFNGARKDHGEITNEASVNKRQTEYQTMVNSFYNLVTDFYEFGWGQSFHFAPRWMGETFNESIVRAEHHLAGRLGLKPGMKALDMGCGVGGPMRNIAIHAQCEVTGITINQYQVNVGNKYNAQKHLDHLCKVVQGDFQNLPFEDGTFDAAFGVEATCHSPDRVACFSEAYRVLKPGGMFAIYDWVVTEHYDVNNVDHVRIKEGIEVGNGLPTLVTPEEVKEAVTAAGFELVDAYDANSGVHSAGQIAWYETLNGSMTLKGFRMTRLGRVCTHALVSTLELLRIAPKGSRQVSALLNATAIDLVDGGKMEIFTPSYFVVAVKK